MGEVVFVSDLENPKNIILPSFDNMNGERTLLSIDVLVNHSGQVDMAVDNDDPFQGARVRARMIRNGSVSGPDVFHMWAVTTPTIFVDLEPDDGDGGDTNIFDSTGPDGHDFGTISYGPVKDGPFHPSLGLYDTNGPGSVIFTVSPLLMVNDLQWDGAAPDAWQMEVQNPSMTLKVKLAYNYIPEPATVGLLGLGALALLRVRRRR